MGRTGFLGRATHLERALFWEVSAPRRPRWRSHTSAGAVLRWDRQSGLRLSPDQPVGVGVGLRGSGCPDRSHGACDAWLANMITQL
jgi:hypothetical protein